MLRQIKTPRGGEVWYASQVSNLMVNLEINTYQKSKNNRNDI